MKKTCLNCKWEPEWKVWVGAGEYVRCYGHCRYPVKNQLMPQVYTVTKKMVERFSDDSGVMGMCHTWEGKDE